jgi:hypothetical protein
MAGFFSDLISGHELSIGIPPEAANELKKAARMTAVHNAFYEDRISRILRDISAPGVECLLLKGFSYMTEIYGNNSARKVSDIDLLIHPADRFRVLDYILNEGFTPYIDPGFRGTRDEFMEVTDFTGESHFAKKSGALTFNLDLHWKMQACFEGYPLNDMLSVGSYPWWETCSSTDIGGMAVKRLSPEMQFIHMAVHFAAHHQYNGLRWFIEFSLFLKKYGNDLDWQFIRKTAAASHCRKLIGVTMRMASEVLGDSWPAAASWRAFLPPFAMLPGEYHFYKKNLRRDYRSRLAVYVCMAFSPSTLAGRFRMVSYFLFNPEAVMFWRVSGMPVPKWLQPCYIFYRLIRDALRKRHA